MKNLENLEISDLETDLITESQSSLELLKDEVECMELNKKYEELLSRSESLYKRYEKVTWKKIWKMKETEVITPLVFNEWRLQVKDREKGTHYALYWYGWLSGSTLREWYKYLWKDGEFHKAPEKWTLPKLIVFGGKTKEYKLNSEQYKKMLDKIEGLLYEEQTKIKELESRKGTSSSVDDIISRL